LVGWSVNSKSINIMLLSPVFFMLVLLLC